MKKLLDTLNDEQKQLFNEYIESLSIGNDELKAQLDETRKELDVLKKEKADNDKTERDAIVKSMQDAKIPKEDIDEVKDIDLKILRTVSKQMLKSKPAQTKAARVTQQPPKDDEEDMTEVKIYDWNKREMRSIHDS